jgi:hypothetical protein
MLHGAAWSAGLRWIVADVSYLVLREEKNTKLHFFTVLLREYCLYMPDHSVDETGDTRVF